MFLSFRLILTTNDPRGELSQVFPEQAAVTRRPAVVPVKRSDRLRWEPLPTRLEPYWDARRSVECDRAIPGSGPRAQGTICLRRPLGIRSWILETSCAHSSALTRWRQGSGLQTPSAPASCGPRYRLPWVWTPPSSRQRPEWRSSWRRGLGSPHRAGRRASPPAPRRLFLVRAASSMPRLRSLCEREGPEPLRRRGLLAPPEFLSIA